MPREARFARVWGKQRTKAESARGTCGHLVGFGGSPKNPKWSTDRLISICPVMLNIACCVSPSLVTTKPLVVISTAPRGPPSSSQGLISLNLMSWRVPLRRAKKNWAATTVHRMAGGGEGWSGAGRGGGGEAKLNRGEVIEDVAKSQLFGRGSE